MYFFLSSVIIFLGKSFADVFGNEAAWNRSWFKKFKKTSFLGPKDYTSERKDSMGAWISSHTFLSFKISNYLSHTILVPLTDAWHFSNTIRRVGIYLAVFFALKCAFPTLEAAKYTAIFIAINQTGFWLFYNYIIQKSAIKA
jgi:hypothetical protein